MVVDAVVSVVLVEVAVVVSVLVAVVSVVVEVPVSVVLVEPPEEIWLWVPVMPALARRASSWALVMQVSAPLASPTQSSLVRTRLAKKSPILFVASANQLAILPKKPAAKLCEAGVVLAVVEEMASKFQSMSWIALANTAVTTG